MGWFKRAIVRCLELPPDPCPPAGSEESVRIFRAAPNYYRYAQILWAMQQAGVVVGILFVIGFWQPLQNLAQVELTTSRVEQLRDDVPMATWAERLRVVEVRPMADEPGRVVLSFGPILFWGEMIGIALVLLQMPVTYTLMQLDYELRWYIVTDRSLRIREGVTTVRESTMTFANIQNLAIEQGPIQRLLGIADLRVRTAGGGSGKEDDSSGDSEKADSLHVGYFRGLANAPELRDVILAYLQRLKSDDGLGDPERPGAEGGVDGVVEAGRAMLDEARALHAVIRSSR